MTGRNTRSRLIAGVALLIAVTLSLSACSNSTTGSSPKSPGSATAKNASLDSTLTAFRTALTQGYNGVQTQAPVAGPAAVTGKTVWYISALQACAGCALQGAGFTAAAKAIGWQLKYVDGAGNPANVSAAINQAVAAKADGIAMSIFDCSTVKNALEKAKAAGIPVISVFGTDDCNPQLFTASTTLTGKPGALGLRDYNDVKTGWAIMKARGNVKAIDIKEGDLQSTIQEEHGYQDAMTKCGASCKTVGTVDLTLSNQTKIQELLSAQLAKNPEANVVNVPNGGDFPQGALAAMKQGNRYKKLIVIGSACDGGEVDLMRQGWTIVCGGYQQQQFGWMAVDYLNRLFSGESAGKLPAAGIGYQLVDADHNLPKDGKNWSVPTNYEAAYRTAWAG